MTRNLIHSDAIADFRGIIASPGAILLEENEILAAGSPQEIGVTDEVPSRVQGIVLPPLANAHSHLDLSGIGTQPFSGSFVSWLENTITPIRKLSCEEDVQGATKLGIELAIAGGTAMVGDIASSIKVADQVSESPLLGVSFIEVFGLGNRQDRTMKMIQSLPNRVGISPHAPYSCGLDVFRAAFNSGKPIATHLAEIPEEFEFAMHGVGPLVEFAKKVGVWDDSVEKWTEHPLDKIIDMLEGQKLLAAHLNYIEERHLEKLADSSITVAYCPRASAYFGHSNHRFQQMLDSGVSVALGTDSLLCLDTPDRISVLDDMRLLYKQGCTDHSTILSMATTSGAKALGEDPSLLTLEIGEVAGLIAIETTSENPMSEAMNSSKAPIWILPMSG
ncbi:MAG: amidohydrolase family protein [Phycisphaerales bacterium]|nr:amidohydrolase family protein [Phycisphaerales bacterium]